MSLNTPSQKEWSGTGRNVTLLGKKSTFSLGQDENENENDTKIVGVGGKRHCSGHDSISQIFSSRDDDDVEKKKLERSTSSSKKNYLQTSFELCDGDDDDDDDGNVMKSKFQDRYTITSESHPLEIKTFFEEENLSVVSAAVGRRQEPNVSNSDNLLFFNRNLVKDVERLKSRLGVDVLVVLMQSQELISCRMENLIEECKKNGVLCINYPIPRYGIPNSPTNFFEFALSIKNLIAEGKKVTLMSLDGKDRAWMVYACILLLLGNHQNDMTMDHVLNYIQALKKNEYLTNNVQLNFSRIFSNLL